ncbi:unnamed protein product [Caenorhabditis auriculariae]|uniref:snRNA-activating protein complex subunit 3 n=1 Tax=Caenorhabditis auriculariae TaxID=2777116 RepID=A0A8S1HJE2_9PELO|nr:unnamed protein product [Caenorhabditis auriculariae]
MSMDHLLRAEEQKFVSPVVFFDRFQVTAARCSELLTDLMSRETVEETLASTSGLDFVTAEYLVSSIDVSDLRSAESVAVLTEDVDCHGLSSQRILKSENSRRKNPQYKSIALRALKYDHIKDGVLARKSPYKKDKPGQMKKETEDGVMKEEMDSFDMMDSANNELIKLETEDLSYNEEKLVKLEPDEPLNVGEPLIPDEFHIPWLDNDIVVSVSVFFGYSRELAYHELRLGRLLKVTDRIELCGSNTLLDLKESFSCPVDYAFMEDFSEKVPTVEDFSKNKFPSSFFFIHDTFYLDMESPNSEDISLPIREWMSSRGVFGPTKIALMRDTRMDQIIARLGQPYVYMHQGICEHIVCFNDIVLRDVFYKNCELPRRLVERNFRRIACGCCKCDSAKWTVMNHHLLPSPNMFLCEQCYQEFCFEAESGKKTSEFVAVPYCDRKEVGESGRFITTRRF